jgi:ribonucleoside-diphosphate reductase alpha chain
MKLSNAGQRVFDARYAAKDDSGNIVENFDQAVRRVARAAASAEKKEPMYWEERFTDIIGNLLFVPSTPIWANMGKTDRPWQPSACFVLSTEDDLVSMYQTLSDTAVVFKTGGGTGYNFSNVRPKGDLVHSTKGKASGVVELVRLYDASACMITQGGVRRGASMAILNADHPEICNFINAKLDGSLPNFNLSVGMLNKFMDALGDGLAW